MTSSNRRFGRWDVVLGAVSTCTKSIRGGAACARRLALRNIARISARVTASAASCAPLARAASSPAAMTRVTMPKSNEEVSPSAGCDQHVLRRQRCQLRLRVAPDQDREHLVGDHRHAGELRRASAAAKPTSTTMRMSTPMARAISTGTFSAMPPSTSSRPSRSTGENTPGADMLARMALVRSPESMITASPVSRSVATARNGVGSSIEVGDARHRQRQAPQCLVELLPLDQTLRATPCGRRGCRAGTSPGSSHPPACAGASDPRAAAGRGRRPAS